MSHLGAHHGLRTQVLGADGYGQVEAAETDVDGFEAVSGGSREQNEIESNTTPKKSEERPPLCRWGGMCLCGNCGERGKGALVGGWCEAGGFADMVV